ncbi:MAG: hypothetical protein K8R73_11045, partial [Clostridiales bacterium]|nr:hypothetical protein [Clostridiales bacterium]
TLNTSKSYRRFRRTSTWYASSKNPAEINLGTSIKFINKNFSNFLILRKGMPKAFGTFISIVECQGNGLVRAWKNISYCTSNHITFTIVT